jgi:hypothetical protein
MDIEAAQKKMYEREINFLSDEMDDIVGIPSKPRYPEENKTIQMNRNVINNIKIDNSTIGVLNTGIVRQINNETTQLNQKGQNELSKAILELLQAVLMDLKNQTEAKNEVIEFLSVLSAEANLKKEDRRTGAMKAILQQLSHTVSTINGLSEIWTKVGPVIKSAFIG